MSNQAPKRLFYFRKQLSTGRYGTMYDNVAKTVDSHPLKHIEGRSEVFSALHEKARNQCGLRPTS
ncbi:hypothetical protein EMIT043CA1_70193 [Pseudomonas brassicacearum]